MLVTGDTFAEAQNISNFDARMRAKKEAFGVLHRILPPGLHCLLYAFRANLELL